jgi:hypothetical protein
MLQRYFAGRHQIMLIHCHRHPKLLRHLAPLAGADIIFSTALCVKYSSRQRFLRAIVALRVYSARNARVMFAKLFLRNAPWLFGRGNEFAILSTYAI